MKKVIEFDVPEGYKEVIVKENSQIIINFIKIDNKEMEDFFKPFLTDLMIIIKPEFPNSVFYKKDGEVIFELYQDSENKEKRYFYVDYYKIWSVFYNKFNLNYNETQSFIKGQVEDTLKLGSVTPAEIGKSFFTRWKTF